MIETIHGIRYIQRIREGMVNVIKKCQRILLIWDGNWLILFLKYKNFYRVEERVLQNEELTRDEMAWSIWEAVIKSVWLEHWVKDSNKIGKIGQTKHGRHPSNVCDL